jgi:uncharacterized phage protein (TIGR01671 family)
MREIKFRYWNQQGKHFHYDPITVMGCLQQQLMGIYDHVKDGCDFQQYTGLKDKNGKEIYEGDIIRFKTFDEHGQETDRQGTLVYEDGSFRADDFIIHWNFGMSYVEAIGNVHENHGLLK